MEAPVTPMMKQYFQIKEEYKDCILFFRLGDFYEMFYDDAITASRVLEITLTGKDCGQKERAPMCGVPFHSAEGYIAKLVKNGLKVAICEQVEDPKAAKGIVRRDVIRVITPGTANIDSVLTDASNNFLACIYIDDDGCGISFADVSTGELLTTELTEELLENRIYNTIACFSPSELIINDRGSKHLSMFRELDKKLNFYSSYIEEHHFEETLSREIIAKKFGASVFASENLDEHLYCLRSLGAILTYLEETQKTDLSHMNKIRFFSSDEYMDIDASSRRNLELTETLRDKAKKGSLFGILDKTKTSMGTRRMKDWIDRPLINETTINMRLEAVDELVNAMDIRCELTEALKKIYDIERIISKIVYGTCNARDFVSLRQSFEVLPEIDLLLKKCTSPMLSTLSNDFDTMKDMYTLICDAIADEPPVTVREGGMIREGFDTELDRLKRIHKSGAGIVAEIEAKEKEATQIKTLKVSYNKVFGYYIEVPKSQAENVPGHYIRKQTLVNNERYITQELKEIENTILGAKERINELEYEDFMYVRNQLNDNSARLQKCATVISIADVLCAFANVAADNGYCRPVVDSSDIIDIKNGRHPIVELALTDSMFVPNDTYLDTGDNRFSIITGPNMAGKSTYMRQTALITLMAQIGSFVPADSCHIGITDRIFTRVGASDDLAMGQSTFMVEMSEVANILKNATKNSLLILDEIGRGTSTFDGLSIAWAVVEYISKNIGAKSLFSTHYHELTELENKLKGVKNYSIAVKKRGEGITFLRKIVRGGTDDSFGIEVAYLADVPHDVIVRAREILSAIESNPANKTADVAQVEEIIEKQTSSVKIDNNILERIKNIDLSTITPIEAMNELYKLQKEVCKLNED
ncbi:MAG: DNA mismatch repair protein MutS [Clostridia bacterium]|nr:DNA mismatch repair protein MutS [Clostridia bacterium]